MKACTVVLLGDMSSSSTFLGDQNGPPSRPIGLFYISRVPILISRIHTVTLTCNSSCVLHVRKAGETSCSTKRILIWLTLVRNE